MFSYIYAQWTRSDMFGHVRTRSDIFGHVRARSDIFGHVRICSDMFGLYPLTNYLATPLIKRMVVVVFWNSVYMLNHKPLTLSVGCQAAVAKRRELY